MPFHRSGKRHFESIYFGICFAAIMGISGFRVQSYSQNQDAEARLRARAEAFWRAMTLADFAAAANFVHPETRDYFIHRLPKSGVEKWKIDKLEFNQDRTECDVAMLVTKMVPMFNRSVDWPLKNHWILSEGEWFFQLPWKQGENPMMAFFKEEQEKSARAPKPEPNVPAMEPQSSKRVLDIAWFQRLVPDQDNPASVHAGEKVVFRYRYENQGSQPIKILSVDSDCHCTSAKKEYPEVAPGQSGNIEVTLDTFGLPAGTVDKEVRVQFSDLQSPIIVRIRTQNLPNFVVDPQGFDFGLVETAKPAQGTIRISNQSGREIKILSGSNSDLRLQFKLDKNVIRPDEELQVTLKYESESKGEFMDLLMLRTDLAAEPLINIRIKGTVK
jgi:hypothetical protein